MIFFTENPIVFEEGQFYTIQGMAGLPPLPPGRTVIGQGYSLVATPGTPVVTGSVSIQYLSNDVLNAGASEEQLTLYYYTGTTWSALPTIRDTYFNLATAPSQGAGLYALMSSIQIPLASAGWNLFAYPSQLTQPVPQALLSISGSYTTVYGYVVTDTLDPWKLYDVTIPPPFDQAVNDLKVLEYGHGYWINVSQAITIHLSSAQAIEDLGVPASPPDTYYGQAASSMNFTPTAGMTVVARINGINCGQGTTASYQNQIVYVVDVLADDGVANAGCGQSGRVITFTVGGRAMTPTAAWDNSQLNELNLSPAVLPASVMVSGPATGRVNTLLTFTATVTPASTTFPLTYVWQATGQSSSTNEVNATTNTVSFTWSAGGTKTLTVTAANLAGSVTTTRTVTIIYPLYLPLIRR